MFKLTVQFCQSLRQTGDLSRVYPASRPKTAGLQPPTTLKWIIGKEWMDFVSHLV